MWMVGYNEGGELNMADYAFNGRKLRPLMPRPLLTSPNNTNTSSARIHHHGHDFFSQYHNLAAAAAVAEQSKRELNGAPAVVVSSSRWNPTPEQLRALEELYRRGTRTPSAEQIQQITAQLRRYGKIEGKNVFYWFQNHKARERQKRRRQMESASATADPRDFDAAATSLDKKDYLGAASRTTVFQVEHNNNCNWAPSSSTTNCTTTLAEESVSIQRAAKAADCRTTDGWLQFDDGELQQRRNFMERNATWHTMQLCCPLPPNNNNSNAPSSTTSMTTATASLTTRSLMDPKLIKSHDLSFFISPHTQNGVIHFTSIRSEEDDNSVESQQTLQLFPTRRDESSDHNNTNHHPKETEMSAQEAMNAPSQFFEFLPLKN